MSDEEEDEQRRLTEGGISKGSSWSGWSSLWKQREDYHDENEPEEEIEKIQENIIFRVSGDSQCSIGELAPHCPMNSGAARISNSPSPKDIRLLHDFVEDIEKEQDELNKPKEDKVKFYINFFFFCKKIYQLNIYSFYKHCNDRL